MKWVQDEQVDKWNRIVNWLFFKKFKVVNWEKILFSTKAARTNGQLYETNTTLISSLAPHAEINLKWIIHLKIKSKTAKF